MTLFPDMVDYILGESIIGRAQKSGAVEINTYNIRDFSEDKHRRVDDTPYGGGKGKLTIALLVVLADLCTANNTVALITVGPMARDIADRYGVDRRMSASLLDTFSCFVQGIIPYGAQLLMAAGLASITPFAIIGYLYYPFALGAISLLGILLRYPRKYS